MSISVTCQSCETTFDAADDSAGAPAHCPKCGSATVVLNQSSKKGIPLATERQKEYARELGIDFPENINRREISNLIDETVAKSEEERYRRLDELERREAAFAESVSVAHASTSQMIEALENRGALAVLITLDPPNGVLDFTNVVGLKLSIESTNGLDRHDMESAILAAAGMIVEQRRGNYP